MYMVIISQSELVNHVPLFVTPWTVTRQASLSNSPGKNTGVGCYLLLKGIFLTQGSNSGLLHCRWILYNLSTLPYIMSPMYYVNYSPALCCMSWIPANRSLFNSLSIQRYFKLLVIWEMQMKTTKSNTTYPLEWLTLARQMVSLWTRVRRG